MVAFSFLSATANDKRNTDPPLFADHHPFLRNYYIYIQSSIVSISYCWSGFALNKMANLKLS